MSHYPTKNEFLDTWIRSTVRSLLEKSADQAILCHVFGNEAIPAAQTTFLERTYAEAFYGDFHHPRAEFQPWTEQLMYHLPFNFLLEHLNSAGSYHSWMDLRYLVRRPEFTPELLKELATQSAERMDENLHLPSPAIVAELYRLTFP
jgi:hypothetical protein